ncbi:MAG: hypothetical protein GW939_04135 [Candidatus Magasanikbacteria bacterium]|nr:hypothetical protein [Candidatus Magasanikbacteria bacterium]NCS72435.1 hypothetical protein [Candidatus Magasanikbacteria bacterium]
MKKYFVSFVIICSVFLPSLVFGQGLGNAAGNLQNTAGRAGVGSGNTADIQTIVGTAINAALTLVGLVFLVLMVYAGFLWMTARGDEPTVEKSKKIISAAVIGLVLIMSAYAVTFFITSRFGG